MNKILLTGRLTKDLELRATSTGKDIVNYQLAVRRDKDNTDFINITTFGEFAKILNEYCQKGDMIGIEGRLQIDNYTDKDGNNKTSYSVISDKIDFLQLKKETKKESPKEIVDETQITDSDLPF